MTDTQFDAEAFKAATGVSRETVERFELWRVLLEKWSTRINLVGPSALAEFWSRHALDSIQVLDSVPDSGSHPSGALEPGATGGALEASAPEAMTPEGAAPETAALAGVTSQPQRWADLGSGAGFPGLAVAIAALGVGRSIEVHLIEANQKKAAFLREVVRATGAPAVVRAVRVEEIGRGAGGETFDVITARAFAPLTRLAGYAESLWKDDTVGVFLKGREAEVELTEAAKSWRFQSDTRPSRSDPSGRIVRIRGLEHVPDA